MLFTQVIFSTCGFFLGSLVITKLTHSPFMSKKCLNEWNNLICGYFNSNNIKRNFFTSPQLKITLFKPVFLQLAFVSFTKKIKDQMEKQLIKREVNVSTY